MAPTKDVRCYFGPLTTIQVEDTLFQAPRKELEQSEVFRTMFSIPPGEGTVVDGQSDKQPLHLEGISVHDFRAFLIYLYPGLGYEEDNFDLNVPRTLSSESELLAVLALAKMWCFEKIRDKVIDKLDHLPLAPARKIELARIHDIRQWYSPALENLYQSHTALTTSEMDQIGTDLALMVLRLKEIRMGMFLKHFVACSCKQPQSSSAVRCAVLSKGAAKVEIDTPVQKCLQEYVQSHGWDK